MDNLEQKIDAPKTGEGNQPSDNITLSKAEYEKMQSELNEAKTKLTSSTKESQKLHAISECARNDKYFAKVYRSDKRIANEVAKHFGYADAEALDKKLKEQHGDDYAPNVDPEEIKKSTKDEVQSEFAKSDLQHFIKEKGLKEGTSSHTRFLEEFNDLIEGKEMTRENVAKYAKKARKILMDDDNFGLEGAPIIGRGGKAGASGKPAEKLEQSIYEKYKVSKEY